ncbi:MAG: hypothetical protein M1825_002296 [Sarcosagium campestre]|nr:MAG: hypothetical protein M1825_002296 [Sarcosagium campestre]
MGAIDSNNITYMLSTAYYFSPEGANDIRRRFEVSSYGKDASCTYDSETNIFRLDCNLDEGDACIQAFFALLTDYVEAELRSPHRPSKVGRIKGTHREHPIIQWHNKDGNDTVEDLEEGMLLYQIDNPAYSIVQIWKPKLDQTDLRSLLLPLGEDLIQAICTATECNLDIKYGERCVYVAGRTSKAVEKTFRKLDRLEQALSSRSALHVAHLVEVDYAEDCKITFAPLQNLRNDMLRTTLFDVSPGLIDQIPRFGVSRLMTWNAEKSSMEMRSRWKAGAEKTAMIGPKAVWKGFEEYRFKAIGSIPKAFQRLSANPRRIAPNLKRADGSDGRQQDPQHHLSAEDRAAADFNSKLLADEQARVEDAWFQQQERAPLQKYPVPVKSAFEPLSNSTRGMLLDLSPAEPSSDPELPKPEIRLSTKALVPSVPRLISTADDPEIPKRGKNTVADSAWSDSSKGSTVKNTKREKPSDTIKEQLSDLDEPSTRKFKETMRQKKSRPASPEPPETNSKEEDSDPLKQSLRNALKLAILHHGQLTLQMQIGRILMHKTPSGLNAGEGIDVSGWDAAMSTDTGPSPHFTNMITTNPNDADVILGAVNDDGQRIFQDEVYEWQVVYEFTLLTQDGDTILIDVDAEDPELSGVIVKKPHRKFGATFIHYPKWNWDALFTLDGTTFLRAEDFPEAVTPLIDNLYIPIDLKHLELCTEIPGKFPRIKSVRLRRHTRHLTTREFSDSPTLSLQITEVQDLLVQQHPAMPGVIRAHAQPRELMNLSGADPRLWYEASLHATSTVETAFKQNVKLEVGEQVEWDPTTVIGPDEVAAMKRATTYLIRACERVGVDNRGQAAHLCVGQYNSPEEDEAEVGRDNMAGDATQAPPQTESAFW